MKTILTVDDSASIRQMLAYVLSNSGYRVIEAADGEEGLALAHANAVDLVLTDHNMPKMDGVTLTRALRAIPAYRKVPIMILTTESSPALKPVGW
jgi:two-component system, chemotaxis family, chemotaxis protein CheY